MEFFTPAHGTTAAPSNTKTSCTRLARVALSSPNGMQPRPAAHSLTLSQPLLQPVSPRPSGARSRNTGVPVRGRVSARSTTRVVRKYPPARQAHGDRPPRRGCRPRPGRLRRLPLEGDGLRWRRRTCWRRGLSQRARSAPSQDRCSWNGPGRGLPGRSSTSLPASKPNAREQGGLQAREPAEALRASPAQDLRRIRMGADRLAGRLRLSRACVPWDRLSATAHWPNSSVLHPCCLREAEFGTNPRTGSIFPMQLPIFVLRLPSPSRTVLYS